MPRRVSAANVFRALLALSLFACSLALISLVLHWRSGPIGLRELATHSRLAFPPGTRLIGALRLRSGLDTTLVGKVEMNRPGLAWFLAHGFRRISKQPPVLQQSDGPLPWGFASGPRPQWWWQYTGTNLRRATVPVPWDGGAEVLVTNESRGRVSVYLVVGWW